MRAGIVLAFALVAFSHAWSADTPLILISLDGFRCDYTELHPNSSPTLEELKRNGVSTQGLIPAFPTNTFPNHYTLVTGLYPSRHGIVNNDFFDPDVGMFFRYLQPSSARDPRWWGGEPIWITAVNQGKKAAASFWVGSEALINGVRPTYWRPYDHRLPFEKRLDEFIGWMKLPAAERPAFVAFYLEELNTAGHSHGPQSREVATTIQLLDRRIATLLARLRGEGIEPNLVVVSDHGMAAVDPARVAILDDFIALSRVQVDFDGSVVGLRPREGDSRTLVRDLARIPHASVYRAEDLPAHFQLGPNRRIPPVWIIPDEGAHVVLRTTYDRLRARYSPYDYLPGDHGYDPALPSMHGVLIAHGPAFRIGAKIPAVKNIHVYNLLCALLGLTPAANDGDDRLVRAALR